MFKKNNKKGISPLIATVIIIGFTIVLAALVIQFGTNFLKQTTEGAERQGTLKQLCTINLASLDMKATKTAGGYDILIDNKNNVKVEGLIMRAYESPTKVGTIVKTTDDKELAGYILEPFSVQTLSVAAPTGITPKEVGILPKVRVKASDPEPSTCDNEIKVGIVGA